MISNIKKWSINFFHYVRIVRTLQEITLGFSMDHFFSVQPCEQFFFISWKFLHVNYAFVNVAIQFIRFVLSRRFSWNRTRIWMFTIGQICFSLNSGLLFFLGVKCFSLVIKQIFNNLIQWKISYFLVLIWEKKPLIFKNMYVVFF